MKILVDGPTSLQQISVKDTNRFGQIKCIQRKTNTCVTLLTQLMHSPFSDRYSAYATSAKIFDSQLSNYFDTLTTILTEIINYFKCRGRSFLAVNPSTKQQYIQFSEFFFLEDIFISHIFHKIFEIDVLTKEFKCEFGTIIETFFFYYIVTY